MNDFPVFRNEILQNFSLKNLGNRIIIFGPMASGKSTTAELLGKKSNLPVHHLDQLYFLPNTPWEGRPFEDFQEKHNAIIESENWIIDGNYRETFKERVARATAILWFNPPVTSCIFRFYKRFFRKNRHVNPYPGRVTDVKENFTIRNLKYIFRFKRNLKYFLRDLDGFPPEKILYLSSFKEVKMLQKRIT